MAIPVSSDNSNTANLNQVNNVIRQLENESQTKVFKGPNNVNALISGKLPNDLGYGLQLSDTDDVPRIIAYINSSNEPILKVSESGVDVTTASNDNLIFNSSQNVLKVVLTGTTTLTVPGSPSGIYTATVTHDLGYVPCIISFVQIPSTSYVQMPFTSMSQASPNTINGVIYSDISSTTANFNINTNNAFFAGNYTFKYYLLQESAA